MPRTTLAACAAAIIVGFVALFGSATRASAALFTFETTFTATPNVVQPGEAVLLHLTATLIPDLAADAAAGVIVFGMSFPQQLTIFDDFSVLFGGGPPHLRDFVLQLSSAATPSEYTFAVSYDTPGTYFPTFQSIGELSIGPIGGGAIQHVGYSIFGRTEVSVGVPGPVAGAGLPGLAASLAFFLAYLRRRRSAYLA